VKKPPLIYKGRLEICHRSRTHHEAQAGFLIKSPMWRGRGELKALAARDKRASPLIDEKSREKSNISKKVGGYCGSRHWEKKTRIDTYLRTRNLAKRAEKHRLGERGKRGGIA